MLSLFTIIIGVLDRYEEKLGSTIVVKNQQNQQNQQKGTRVPRQNANAKGEGCLWRVSIVGKSRRKPRNCRNVGFQEVVREKNGKRHISKPQMEKPRC